MQNSPVRGIVFLCLGVFIFSLQDAVIKQSLIENTERAVERGVFGIPTFFVGPEMFFGKERLGQVEEMLENS